MNTSIRFRRRGVSTIIGAVILILIFFGIFMAFLINITSSINTWQQTYFPAGVFIQDFLTAGSSLINYWPILFILLPVLVWGLVQAMRRREGDGGFTE